MADDEAGLRRGGMESKSTKIPSPPKNLGYKLAVIHKRATIVCRPKSEPAHFTCGLAAVIQLQAEWLQGSLRSTNMLCGSNTSFRLAGCYDVLLLQYTVRLRIGTFHCCSMVFWRAAAYYDPQPMALALQVRLIQKGKGGHFVHAQQKLRCLGRFSCNKNRCAAQTNLCR